MSLLNSRSRESGQKSDQTTAIERKLDDVLREIKQFDEVLVKWVPKWDATVALVEELQPVVSELRSALAAIDEDRRRLADFLERAEQTIPFLERLIRDGTGEGAISAPRDHRLEAPVPPIRDELTDIWNRLLGDEHPRDGGAAQEEIKSYLEQRGAQLYDLSTSRYPVELVSIQPSPEAASQLLLFPLLGKGLRLYPQEFFEAEGMTGTVRRVLRPARVELLLNEDFAKVLDGVMNGRLDLPQAFRVVQKGVLAG